MTAGFLGTWSSYPVNGSGVGSPTSGGTTNATIPLNPNTAEFNEARTFIDSFKVFGTYTAKWGIVISPVYRFFLGTPEARYITVTGLNVGSETLPLTPVGAYRQQNISIFDTRIEKRFTFKEHYQVAAFFDAFNIFNSNGDQNQTNLEGTYSISTGKSTFTKTAVVNGVSMPYNSFLSGTTIINPRIFRIGGKFTF